MKTPMYANNGNARPESIATKRSLRGPSGTYICVLLALAFVLTPEYSSSQVSSDPCPINTVEPPSGLVGWWPLGEKSGSQVMDRSGHDNQGTSKPGAIGAAALLGPVSAPGFVGNGLRFFGGSYVRINNSTSPQSLLNFGYDAFTIDASVTAGDGPIVRHYNP